MPQAAFRAIVSGRVQVVMYRDFTRRNARSLGIVGEVENLPDGTVRVVAEGEKEALEELERRMKKGSLFSRVNDVALAWQEPTGTFTSFSIRY
jgi:acylphosphatase